ncbi:Uncharacterised protein [Halioglobus japonicus]|nr:Uncharacterised protein [Halioglobus japonicus]
MIKLADILSPRQRLLQQEREIAQLRGELTKLQAQNDSMRAGMRRCVTCEYRIDFKARQDAPAVAEPTETITNTSTETDIDKQH